MQIVQIVLIKDKKGRPEVLYDTYDPRVWPEIEPVINHLKERFAGHVYYMNIDPIMDASKWEMEIEDHKIMVIQSGYGDITIKADRRDGDYLMERVANSLEQHLG